MSLVNGKHKVYDVAHNRNEKFIDLRWVFSEKISMVN